jgi:hypothetical protein
LRVKGDPATDEGLDAHADECGIPTGRDVSSFG